MGFETLLSGWEFLEAPRLAPRGNLYFSDVTAGGLHKLLPDGRIESFLPGRTWIGGIAFNGDGGIVCSGKDGLICFYEKTGEIRPLLSVLGAINDFCPDGAGGVIAGVIDAESVAAARAPVDFACPRRTGCHRNGQGNARMTIGKAP